MPLRALAAVATVLAAGAFALGRRPAVVGCALLLTLSGLSTWLDQAWMGELARRRAALDRDLAAIAPVLPADPCRMVLVAPDVNVANLAFLRLNGRPDVVVADPLRPPPGALEGAEAVVAAGDLAPPGAWRPLYRGPQLSLWRAIGP